MTFFIVWILGGVANLVVTRWLEPEMDIEVIHLVAMFVLGPVVTVCYLFVYAWDKLKEKYKVKNPFDIVVFKGRPKD